MPIKSIKPSTLKRMTLTRVSSSSSGNATGERNLDVFMKITSRFERKEMGSEKAFWLSEYAEAAGIGTTTAQRRLRALVADGTLRRVNVRRGTQVHAGYEYVGA